jgi:hypothetical protein
MDQAISFKFDDGKLVYICKDIPNIDDKFFLDLMNTPVHGHNLAIIGGNNAINSTKPEPFLPELSAVKVREYLYEIETLSCQPKAKRIKTENVKDDDDLDFLDCQNQKQPPKGFSEIVGIDGETIFKGSLQFAD